MFTILREPKTYEQKCRDARARKVGLAHLQVRQLARLADDPDTRAWLTDLDRAVRRNGRILRWAVAGFFFALMIAMVPFMIVIVLNTTMSPQLVVAPLMFGFMGAAVLFGSFAYNPKKARDTLLQHGLCASCLRGLAGRQPEPDGCTVCPECGAAWRLPPRPAGSPIIQRG